MVDFLVANFLVYFSPGNIGFKFVTETSPHSSYRSPQEAKTFVTSCSLWGQSHVRIPSQCATRNLGCTPKVENLLMPLFLRKGCFPVDFQEVKRPLKAKSGKRPIKGGKRPIKEGKRPIKAMVLVGISVGCLMGCFPAPPPWRKTAPLKRPTKGSMIRGRAATPRSKVRVLRRFWTGFWGRVLRRVLRRGSAMGFTVKKGSEKGSQKGF